MHRLDPIIQTLLGACAESHSDFVLKCPNPLWKNPDFFIHLPVKKNEDINPTKATHSGMNPDHFILAHKECYVLLHQRLIEPSDSQWACEAFYVISVPSRTGGK